MLHWFLYFAQVLWEKWCLYNKSCSYGNQDGCLLWKMIMLTWFRQQFSWFYLSVTKYNLGSLWRVLWQMHEDRSWDFMHIHYSIEHCPLITVLRFFLLSRWAVAFWLSSSMVGRFLSTWWVWQLCCSFPACTSSVMSTWFFKKIVKLSWELVCLGCTVASQQHYPSLINYKYLFEIWRPN